jgi:hypothetical protein
VREGEREKETHIAEPFFKTVHLTTSGSALNVSLTRFKIIGFVSKVNKNWLDISYKFHDLHFAKKAGVRKA